MPDWLTVKLIRHNTKREESRDEYLSLDLAQAGVPHLPKRVLILVRDAFHGYAMTRPKGTRYSPDSEISAAWHLYSMLEIFLF